MLIFICLILNLKGCKVDDPIGVGVNSDYRNKYYKHYFDVSDKELKELVKNYLIGIRWVVHYYFQKNPDWFWYYIYDYPPFISDISKYLINMNEIKFNENKAMTQLYYQRVLKDYFLILNHNYHICIQLIFKFIFYINLVRYTYKKYKDELTKGEIHRNRFYKDQFI